MLKLNKFPFTAILGWSASRYDKFKVCQRQYYYDYYAKNHDFEIEKKELLRLKQLTSVALEIGNIFHDVVKAILERLVKSPINIDRDKLKIWAKKLAVDYCKKKEFFEVYYKQLEEINTEEISNTVLEYLDRLLDSERFKWILDNAVQQSKDWMIEPDGFGETRINGLKAYCKVDFLMPLGDKIYIFDWKTGKEDELKQRKQLAGYTSFACSHYEKTADDVICIIYFLKENKEKIVTFTPDEILSFSESILTETQEMYQFTNDINKNIPKSKESFEKTIQTRICDFCNYKGICIDNEKIIF
jgi:hypothetical protein